MKKTPPRRRPRGFMILETMVALLVVSLGLLGMTTLLGQVTGAAGDSKARSEALALAREKLETLRNQVTRTSYDLALKEGTVTESNLTTAGSGIKYTRQTVIVDSPAAVAPASKLAYRDVAVTVSWANRAGTTSTVKLESKVAWSDPAAGRSTINTLPGTTIKPSGSAVRESGIYKPGDTVKVVQGSDTNGFVTQLVNVSRNNVVILSLPPVNGKAQSFTSIKGKVYLDQGASQLPASSSIFVRLSSEGQCDFDNANNLTPVPETNPKFRYFQYTCYVGPGWYGNIGIEVTQSNASPTVCVGDPRFTDTSFTASPAAVESTIRTYRGFRLALVNDVATFISTGMAGEGSTYTYGSDGTTGTKGGSPVPTSYASLYDSPVQAHYNQDFLVSRITGSSTCAQRMAQVANTFSPNAGRNFCITPDNWVADPGTDYCPSKWPGSSAGTCSMTLSGSYNPPTLTSFPGLTQPITSSSSVTCTTSDQTTCACSRSTNTANYSCTFTGGASQSITVTGTTVHTGTNTATLTQQCVRTKTNVGCSAITGFNIDNQTTACTP